MHGRCLSPLGAALEKPVNGFMALGLGKHDKMVMDNLPDRKIACEINSN